MPRQVKLHKSYSKIVDEDDGTFWAEFMAEDEQGFFDLVLHCEDRGTLEGIMKHFQSPTLEPYEMSLEGGR